jgi:hypothetical protein
VVAFFSLIRTRALRYEPGLREKLVMERLRARCLAAWVLAALVSSLLAGSRTVDGATRSARLRWLPSPSEDVTGYRVYVRPAAGSYGPPIDAGLPLPAVDGTLRHVVGGLDTTLTYVFGITAYLEAGIESGSSNEVVLPAVTTTTTSTTSTTTTSSTTTSTVIVRPDCGGATVLPAEGGNVTGIAAGTGVASGSCVVPGRAPEQLFAWTPAVSGTATIETCSPVGTTFDTVLYLRDATCDGPDLACNDDSAGCGTTRDPLNPHLGSRLTPTVAAGETYIIVVDGYGAAQGTFSLSVTPPGAVCTAPAVLPAAGGTFAGTTSGTSAEQGSCSSSQLAPEQIFQWTPAVSGTATIETCNTAATTFDTVLYLRGGTCDGPELACNDDTVGCGTSRDGTSPRRGSRLTPTVTAGQTYLIIVDGFGDQNGSFALTVTPPAGTCTAPAVLPAAGGTFAGTTSGASAVRGSCSATHLAPEQIFQWTPAVSGTATIETCNTAATTFDTVLYLRGSTCDGPELACNDDTVGCGTARDGASPRRGSRLTPSVTAGQTYLIVVDGYADQDGTFSLTVAPPGGAAFAQRALGTKDGPLSCPTGDLDLDVQQFVLRTAGQQLRVGARASFTTPDGIDPTVTGVTLELRGAEGAPLLVAALPGEAFRSPRSRRTFRYVRSRDGAAGPEAPERLVLRRKGDTVRVLWQGPLAGVTMAAARAPFTWVLHLGETCASEPGLLCPPAAVGDCAVAKP